MNLVAWLPLHHSHYKLKAALTRLERLFKCLLTRQSKGGGGVPRSLQLMSVGEQNLKVKAQSTNRKWFVANEHRSASPLNFNPSVKKEHAVHSWQEWEMGECVNISIRNLSLKIILFISANRTHFHSGRWKMSENYYPLYFFWSVCNIFI